jgi:hypothetical protein
VELGLADLPFGASSREVDKLVQEGKLLLRQNGQNVYVGARVQAKMCENDNFQGKCENRSQNSERSISFLSGLRSMKVWNVCARRENQVALFAESEFFGPCIIRETGEYSAAKSLAIEGGAIRSIDAGPGVEARVCSEENMQGECVDVTGRMNVSWTIKSLKVRSPQDDAKAVESIRKAAEQGDATAQVSLGIMYAHGRRGLPQDDAKAVEWYRKAAEQGNATAQVNLGFMYAHGRGGLPQDDAKAVEWYRKAAEQGNTQAQANLGIMYAHGRGGLPQDDAKAVEWYRKAAEQGNATAQVNLGFMYAHGRGGLPQDDDEALEWYQKAAEQGDVAAQNYLKNRGLKW